MHIAGFHDPRYYPSPDEALEMQRNAMDHFMEDSFNVMMVHNYDHMDGEHAEYFNEIGIHPDTIVHGHSHWGDAYLLGILYPMVKGAFWNLNGHYKGVQKQCDTNGNHFISINNRGSSFGLHTKFPFLPLELMEVISHHRMFTVIEFKPVD